MHNLKTDIKTTVNIADNDLRKILENFELKTYDKSTVIHPQGKTSNHLRFIEKGLIRVYTIGESGKESTIQIGIENMWVNDHYSFITQTPSKNQIEALEETSILQIQRQDLEFLYKKLPVMESFMRLKMEQSYIRLYNRIYHQMNDSAEERYLTFKNTYGHIESRVPQYIIASYLNLTPEHLSKVRRILNSR